MGRGQGSLIRARFEDVLAFIEFTLLVRFSNAGKPSVPGIQVPDKEPGREPGQDDRSMATDR